MEPTASCSTDTLVPASRSRSQKKAGTELSETVSAAAEMHTSLVAWEHAAESGQMLRDALAALHALRGDNERLQVQVGREAAARYAATRAGHDHSIHASSLSTENMVSAAASICMHAASGCASGAPV